MSDASQNIIETQSVDKTGVSLSILCLIHCIGGQALVLLFPIFHEFADEYIFHRILGPILFLIAGYAFHNGYKRHKQKRVLYLGSLGILFLLSGIFAPHDNAFYSVPFTVWLSSIGSIFLILAHIWNIKYCKCANPNHKH